MRLFIACVTILGVAKAALAIVPLCGCKPTSPVCGSDLKTYSSECSLACDNHYSLNPPVLIYNGPCEDLLPVKPDPINPYPINPYPINPYPINPYPINPYPINPIDPYNPNQPCNPFDIYNPCLYLGAHKKP